MQPMIDYIAIIVLVMIKLINIQQQMIATNNQDRAIHFLRENLYSIEPVLEDINRELLALAYTPGVGTVCLDIQDKLSLSDQFTFRGRAVAIVSDGSLLGSEGKHFMPVMDWFVHQLKHYTGLDGFPFVVAKETDLDALLKDLSTSYGTVLYLDSKEIKVVPNNILFVSHQTVLDIHHCEKTNANFTSTAIGYFIAHHTKGSPNVEEYKTATVSPHFRKTINTSPFQLKGNDLKENSRQFHRQYEGKIKIVNSKHNFAELLQFFTDETLRQIVKLPDVYSKTSKLSVIVTDGTSILGFGDIGPAAGLPVMQGKSLLFRILGEVEVVPFCMYPRKTAQDQVQAIANTIGNFLAVNLEDIKAPECFDVEVGLKSKKLLPVFHDDQHGTAIVVLAALINSLKVADKSIDKIKIVINGAGAAGITIAKLLLSYGANDVIVCDTKGAIFKERVEGMNRSKKEIAEVTNKHSEKGQLSDVINKADVFIGVSAAGALKGEWIKTMNQKPIIFALANPTPQILPQEAKQNGAFIYGSGRSDFQNQINNSLAFPGIFRSIKQHNLKEITQQMKLKASIALSKCLDRAPTQDYVIAASLDKNLSVVISNQIGN